MGSEMCIRDSWCRVGVVDVNNNAASGTQLSLTGTSGRLDDSGAVKVNGITLTETRSGGGGPAACVMSWPNVDLLS